jgi:ankyrin repeat protein
LTSRVEFLPVLSAQKEPDEIIKENNMKIEHLIVDKAIDKRNKDVINLLLDNIDENCLQNGQKRSLLRRIRSVFDDLDMYKKVLNVLNPNLDNYSCKETELINVAQSVSTKHKKEILKLLIEKGVKINKVDNYSFRLPALQHYLTTANKIDDEIIKLFLDHGADINAVNKNGDNYLMCIISPDYYGYYYYDYEAIQNNANYLINKYGLNIKVRNKKGQSLIEIIEEKKAELNTRNYSYSKEDSLIKCCDDLKTLYLSQTGGI